MNFNHTQVLRGVVIITSVSSWSSSSDSLCPSAGWSSFFSSLPDLLRLPTPFSSSSSSYRALQSEMYLSTILVKAVLSVDLVNSILAAFWQISSQF
jgi:hypothetical protein